VHDGLAIHKSPDVRVKGPELFLNLKKPPGVVDRRKNFSFVPNNAWIAEQLLNLSSVILGNLFRIEVIKGRDGSSLASGARYTSSARPVRLPGQEIRIKAGRHGAERPILYRDSRGTPVC
jgi:hypothetical protein